MYRKGDRVTVTNPNPANQRFRGRLAETVKGLPGFYPEELSPAR